MEAEIYIKYVGTFTENDSEIPLSDLGKSLVSFERLVAELVKICRINGEVVVTATHAREGSQIIDTLIHINGVMGDCLFDSPEYLVQFLKLAEDESWKRAVQYFNEFQNIRGNLNDYASKYPVDFALISYALAKLIKKANGIKQSQNFEMAELPKRMAKELYGLIKRNGFKGFIAPIVNESIGEITVSPDKEFRRGTAVINNKNFEEYLTKDDEILPDFVNGIEVVLEGDIKSLKSTRGDSLTFQYIDAGSVYNLDIFPTNGKNTKHYVKYYKETVRVTAKVERESLYKKPKLHLLEIEQVQGNFRFD